MTDLQKSQIIALHEQGYGYAAIAEEAWLDNDNVAPKPFSQKEIIQDVYYYQAQKVAQSMLDRGLISLDEFNKLTQINRDTFSPFLVEIMPEIR
ncbi:MAG: SHOCT domain-containing protein [Lachnospiraceae bacterium]